MSEKSEITNESAVDGAKCTSLNRVDRLRGLGNAVVPAIVEEIGKMILEVHYANLQGL